MQAGKLRHRILIQVKDTTKNDYGEEVTVWEDDIEVWAAIMPIRGREYFHASNVQSAVTHRVRMRFTKLSDGSLIDANCRIKYVDRDSNTRYFDIEGVVNPEEKNSQLDLMCVEES